MWTFALRVHKADEYFKSKFREIGNPSWESGKEALKIVEEAWFIRHRYPDLSGPELIRLVYWGASGATDDL